MDLFADRTGTLWMASNQLRLWFSAFAHLIMSTLQAKVLTGTELAAARSARSVCDSLRLSPTDCQRQAYPHRTLFSISASAV